MNRIWIKSSRCSGGDCVALAQLDDGRVAVRDSKNPDVELTFTKDEVAAFFAGVLIGDFDHLAGGIDEIHARYGQRQEQA
jgi:hypothetical protein